MPTEESARFVANDAQLTRLIELFDAKVCGLSDIKDMVPPQRDEKRRLTAEIAALGPITEKQFGSWWQNRKSRLAQGKQVGGVGAAEAVGAGGRQGITQNNPIEPGAEPAAKRPKLSILDDDNNVINK